MDIQHLKNITQVFLQDYEKAQRDKLSNEPEWKIDSLISHNSIEKNNLKLKEKIDFLINENQNPFILFSRELLLNLTNNDSTDVIRLISAMTNGRFLDSIGIHNNSNKNETANLIERFVNELEDLKKVPNNI
tara:strand:- start:238 stop:633 length:396 start_codon:yes stop_codon:yes gene_type:complete